LEEGQDAGKINIWNGTGHDDLPWSWWWW